jgi:hypothetical protein
MATDTATAHYIFKYPLTITDYQDIALPAGAKPLCVQMQDERPCLWVLVNADREPDHTLTVRIVGTGNPFPDAEECTYVGTFQMFAGGLVWHVFTRWQPHA